jgi:intraflagellar transport protein 140
MLNDSLGFYKEAQDFGSVVRLLCMIGDVQNALKIALETNDPQACFHLARHYENNLNIREAIVYYSKSQRLTHAIRLAKENGFDQEVMTMSLQASKQNMVQSAHYFETKGKHDKAVQLYSRGGNRKKAMDLAIKHNLTDMIENISTGVQEGDDPEVLKKSVHFLMQNRQFDKAVEIMISLGNVDQALQIAESEQVNLKEEMALKLCPPSTQDPVKKKLRTETLLRVAKIVKKQGDFKLGAKIYTMANEKMKGIKCLLKSGDVKAVIGFAQTARQTEVYILAGNFLQNQNWHNDPEIMKTIISFYQKAKSFESLANFYDACAQVEIDEYRDYEKALGAMKEAMRQLEKATSESKEMKLSLMRKRVGIIEKFVQAREALNSNDSATAMEICD